MSGNGRKGNEINETYSSPLDIKTMDEESQALIENDWSEQVRIN